MEMIKMQVACLCVVLLLTAYYAKSRHLNTRTSKCFHLMLWVTILNLIFEMISVYTVYHMEHVPADINRFANIVFVCTLDVLFGLLLHYILLLIENDIVRAKLIFYIIDVPMLLGVIAVMLVPFQYITTNEGNYAVGIPVSIGYGLIAYYVVLAGAMILVFRKDISREKWQTIFPAFFIFAMISGIQYFNPTYLISGLGMTITILAIFLARENPKDFFNKETGMFNETGFSKMVCENIRMRERFHVILFTVSNMDIIRERYGGAAANACSRVISEKIYLHFHHNTYALDENELVFFAGSSQAAQACVQHLSEWFLHPMWVGKVEILIQTEMKAWTFEKDARERPDDVLYDIEEYFTRVLAKSVYIDYFTGVMNRNAYERDVAHLIRSSNHAESIFCSILDINNLKRMNDSYGHPAGDALIQGCAEILKISLPEDARIYRIGGDEFAVLCFTKEPDEISKIFDGVENACEKMNEGVQYPIDFAVGTARYDSEVDANLFEAFARADKRMYKNKEEMHRREKEHRNQDDWNWIRNLDSVTYESILFHSACEITDNYIFIENKVTNMTRWSPNAVDDFELSGEYIYQGMKSWGALVHPDDLSRYEGAFMEMSSGNRQNFRCNYRVKNRWGEYIRVDERGYLGGEENEKGRIFIGILHPDEQDTQMDPETELYNKYEFSKRVKNLCDRGNVSGGILLIGINHFRKINTIYSYAVGDEVLRIIAQKIQQVAPVKSSQYRYGGDMFAVIYPHCSKEEICYLFENMEKSLEQIELDTGESIYLTISGGAVMLEDGMSSDGVKNSLEHAWMSAKGAGGSILEFASGSKMQESVSMLRMRESIRQCVKEQMYGFYLNYQPIFCGDGKELFGCEALLRWSNPNFDKIGPEQFIPILEENGMIKEAGRWVITNALQQVKEWRILKPDMSVNVNVSYVQLKQPDLGHFIVNELKRLSLPPESIIIEMTESCKISNLDGVLDFVNYLGEHQISFGLDDFGTGYSSFEVLKNVPTDWIKLEHNYVSSYQNSLTDRNIIIHTIQLCHSLGIKVCAEGVEDRECCMNMMNWNVEYLQGYYFGRPSSAGKFEEEFLSGKIR